MNRLEKVTKKIIILLLLIIFNILLLQLNSLANTTIEYDYSIDLSNLSTYTTYTTVEELENAKINGNLPEGIYITTFLYDGVSSVKAYDLDDFIESGNNMTVETVSLTVININTIGNIEIKGELIGGMIAVNTNNKNSDINLYLNGINLDTDDKKMPAIYIYNQDISYNKCKVTIRTVEGTNNYLEGGRFKKVSLIGIDELSRYSQYYSGTYSSYYSTYTNYYGVYTSSQIENILFATVKAKSDDLREGDPYYFYKGTGVISSDIDLNFEGNGTLTITSKNKEGIEGKGNITFSGGTGDYIIYAQDDAINTTINSESSVYSSYNNTLTINANYLAAIVSPEANEGDAIDSNGKLYVTGGTVVALPHPDTPDSGLDSDEGTYIDGGTVFSVRNRSMGNITTNSTQKLLQLTFSQSQTSGNIIFITDTNGNPVIAFETDRNFKILDYSSPNMSGQTYYVFVGDSVTGTNSNGFYTNITGYTLGEQYQGNGDLEFTVSSAQSRFTNVSEYNGTTELEGKTVIPVHQHSLTLVNALTPTCTQSGNIAYYTCSGCDLWFADATGTTEITDKTSVVLSTVEHTWNEWVVTKEATETETGLKQRTCKYNSSHIETETIPVLQHQHILALVPNKEATCSQLGNISYYLCYGCSKKFSNQEATQEITDTIIPIDTNAHDWNEWIVTKEATEIETGLKQRTCKYDSSHIETETIPILDHQHILALVPNKEATCSQTGNISYYLCSGCSKKFSNQEATQEITDTTISIDTNAHDWNEWIITKEATETETGAKQRTCKYDSSHTETEIIPLLGHQHILTLVPNKESTCSQLGNISYYLCSACSKKFSNEEATQEITDTTIPIDTNAHDWNEWIVTKEATKTETGLKQRTCKDDASHVETEIINKLISIDNNQTNNPNSNNNNNNTSNNNNSNQTNSDMAEGTIPQTGNSTLIIKISIAILLISSFIFFTKYKRMKF